MLNPGWEIRPGSPGDSMDDSPWHNDGCLYAVDVGSGWVCMAPFPYDRATRALKQASDRDIRRSLTRAAPFGVAGRVNDRPSHEVYRHEHILGIVLLAVAQTQTFEVAYRQRGNGFAHCLYLVYGLKDGSLLGRPALVSSPKRVSMHPAELRTMVRRVIAMDLLQQTAVVNDAIRAGGGAQVAAEFA